MILDLIALEDTSKVWIYQSNREFTYDELDVAREDIFHFLNAWTAHNHALTCYANVFHRRFLAFFVDESNSSASGCSIDKKVRFVQDLGGKLKIDLFDRMTYAYMEDEEVKTISHSDLKDAFDEGKIDSQTLFFDNLVKDKGDFLRNWIRPISETWHQKFLK